MANTIHPSAIVNNRADLADDVVIGPYCIVHEDVCIGEGTRPRSELDELALLKLRVCGDDRLAPPCELSAPELLEVTADGLYGFIVIPVNGADRKADDPRRTDPAQFLVEVDTKKPEVKVHTVRVSPGGATGAGGSRLPRRFHCRARSRP